MYISWIRSLLLILIFTVVLHSYAAKRSILLNNEQKLLLARNGESQTVIVIPDDASGVVRFAGQELQKFMQQAFNAPVKIVSLPDKQKTSIILGDNSYSRRAGINIDKLPRDGFIIQAEGKNIFIVGKDDKQKTPESELKRGAWPQLFERGTLFGVYDFLERFINVRFYFPGPIGTVIPEYKNLEIPAMNIVENPDYTQRKISWYSGQWYEGKERDKFVHPKKNLNYYRLRMSTEYIPNCHGLARLGYIQRFGKTHPEYFALMSNGKRYNNPALPHSGQLCFSSNIREQIFKDAKAFLTGKSAKEAGILTESNRYAWSRMGCQKGYFNIMPQDGFFPCHCTECQKHFSKGSKASSEFIWGFVTEMALNLKKDKVPGYLTMMAYSPYRDVPNIKIPDNVMVMVAEHGPWGIYNKHIQDKDNKEIRDWVKKTGRKTWLWNYANKYGKREMPGVPQVTPRAIAKYYKEQSPYIFGAYMESETDKYIFNALNYYIFSKVCWDNSVDTDAVLNEYYKLMFGAAAEIMKSIDEKFEELWLQRIGGRTVDTPLGPMAAPPSEYEVWEKIYSPDEIRKLTGQFEKAEKLTAENTKALQRVKFFRKEFLGALISSREKYSGVKNEIDDLVFGIKTLPSDMTIKLDGKLDDPAWEKSDKIYLHPYKGNPDALKTVNTIVYALKDKNNLYFAFQCDEPKMNNMIYTARKNDDKNIWKDSSVELFLNPSCDRKNYYQIIINPTGSFSDLKSKKIGINHLIDWKWNSGASVNTGVNSNGWVAEIAIPIKNIPGFNANGFPANFNRNRLLDKGKDYVKQYTWSPFLKHGFHDLRNFGSLTFGKIETNSILDNGDFTAAPKGNMLGKWYGLRKKDAKPGQSVSLDKSTFIKGGQSLKLVTSMAGQKIKIAQYLPQLKPETKYLLTFYIRTQDIKRQYKYGGVVVNINDGINHWFPKNWFIGSMPWTKQGFEFTTGSETNKKHTAYIRLVISKATGAAWFDDVRLREVNSNKPD